MKVLFLNPPFIYKFSREQRSPAVTKSGTIYYPMWLAHAAGYAQDRGHEIFFIDAPAEDKDIKDVVFKLQKAEFEPEALVMVCSTPSIYRDIKSLEYLKKQFPELVSVLVGTHVSAVPEETLELSDNIDYIAIHEYDETIPELLKVLEENRDPGQVQGLVYKSDEKVINTGVRPYIEDLDKLPFVSRIYKRFLNYKNYFYSANLYPVISLVTGRGCPFQCEYCVYPQTMHGHRFRKRNLDKVIEEMKYIKKSFPGLKEIFFEDDTLTVDKKRVKEFCRKIIENNIDVTWSTNSRAQVDLETLKLMKKAGCRLLCVGYESGDQGILDNLNKNVKLKEELEFAKDTKNAGIKVHGCFLVGYRGETRETLQKTLAWALKLNPDTAQFFPLMVYPGTKAYNWAKSKGLIRSDNYRDWLTPSGLHNTVLDSEEFSGEELVKFCDYARRKFYLRPSYILKRMVEGLFHPREGFRLAKAFLRFIKYLLGGSDV